MLLRPLPHWRSLIPLGALAFSLLVPSTAVVERYFGPGGAVAYLTSGSLLLFLAAAYVYLRVWTAIKEAWIPWLAAATILGMAATIAVAYPLANSGRFGGGSDGDDALMIAASALLQGDFPYQQLTYLGNPISPLPGAVILAIPFVLLGNVAYQNVFWLAVFYWANGRLLRDWRQSLLLLWTILLLSPVVSRGLAAGSDYVSNTIYVLLFSLWVIFAYSEPAAAWQRLLAALLLGIGLSSRANFLLLLPLLFAAIAARAGWREAFKATAITMLSFGLVTLPIYLWDPGAFSPLSTRHEVGQFDDVLPAAGLLIPLLTGLVALALALRDNSTVTRFLGHAALVQATPVLCGIVLTSIRGGAFTFAFARFGVFFLFFGALASWPGVWRLVERGVETDQTSSPTTRATRAR